MGRSQSFDSKWPEIHERGYVQVPKCLITCMGELGLQPQEAATLYVIMEKCWTKGAVSWQKVDTIAASIGRKNSATRTITASLEKKGFLSKQQRFNTSNLYSIEPTAQKLAEHLKHCGEYAKKPEGDRWKPGSQHSQESSSYIEPLLNKTHKEIGNLYSQYFNSEATDDSTFSIDEDKLCRECDGYNWETFISCKGNDVYWKYWNCGDCGNKFHYKIPSSQALDEM